MTKWTDFYKKANIRHLDEMYAILDSEIDQQEKEPEYWDDIERQRWEPIDNDEEYISECCRRLD